MKNIINKWKGFSLIKVCREKLLDFGGWKKDGKKIVIAVIILATVFSLIIFFSSPKWELRLQTPVQFISYNQHYLEKSKISFVYPKQFVFDGDEKKKFGDDYLGGFHLDSDSRTGCDIRTSVVGINFSKDEQQINEAIQNDLKQNVKGLENYSGKKSKIDGKDAFAVNFSLTDPLNNILSISQVMVSNGDQHYLFICGSNKAQTQQYANDFQNFFDSVQWK